MSENPFKKLSSLGQSIWLDYIDREILQNGDLGRLIVQDAIAGLTSNPAIFEKAISKGSMYDADVQRLVAAEVSNEKVYESLILDDIARAADLFLPVYTQTHGRDGFVSIEVSPLLARDTEATIREARDLWTRLARPNIMIKVPGTREGLPAVRQLLLEGINVNVTLLFSVGRYMEVLDTYMEALEARLAGGMSLEHVSSVASFFLSRIDVKVDKLLDQVLASASQGQASEIQSLRGKAAIASAGFAYRRLQEQLATSRWQKLNDAGAQLQRLLWASTGTKDPAYSDIRYVDALVAADTINTVPTSTLEAYRDHGVPEVRIQQAIDDAPGVMRHLAELGIDLRVVDSELEEEGIRKFIEPYQAVLKSLDTLRS